MSTQRIGIHDYTSGAAHVTLTASTASIGSVTAYPSGAVPITAASGNVANAIAAATLATLTQPSWLTATASKENEYEIQTHD